MDNNFLKEIKKLLKYSKKTGQFTWKVKRSNKVKAGDVAGTIDHEGYVKIRIFEKEYRAARLAWLFVNKNWPKYNVDHINGIKTDNRIENLRDVSQRENCQNRNYHRNGKLVGAIKKRSKKYPFTSIVYLKKQLINLGNFKTKEEANKVYLEKIKELKNDGIL